MTHRDPESLRERLRLPKGRRKAERVMKEWKSGDLKSSSGQPVVNRKQAIAIALSEQRRAETRK